jgi:hypothetical protein
MKKFLFGVFLSVLCNMVSAQVTDKPILRIPASEYVIFDINMIEGKACTFWWERDADPYGDYHPVRTALNIPMLSSVARARVEAALEARGFAALSSERTHNVKDSALASTIAPCVASWEPLVDPVAEAARQKQLDAMTAVLPPPAWTVAKTTALTRPAYALNVDGTRNTKVIDNVPVTYADRNGQVKPNVCFCKLKRAVTTTSTTYCATLTRPDLVTLCTRNN